MRTPNWLSSMLMRWQSSAQASAILASQPRNAASAAAFALWSRSSGLLSQSGNADAELKTRVSDDAADDFRRLANELGMNTSELLRVLVLARLYGVEGVARMTQEQLRRVAGVGTEKAL